MIIYFLTCKYMKQLIYSYKLQKNNPESIESTSYTSCRPLKHYRKQGLQSSIQIMSECNSTCSPTITIGLPYKMLAKKENGKTKMCCENTKGPVGSVHGNVMSFSGNAKLRSSIQPNLNVNQPYYTESNSYLKSRGNTFDAKSTFTFNGGENNSYNETTQGICYPLKTIYKPNNTNFATQGAVTSDTRLLKLKYDTITKNNASFTDLFKTKIEYQENPIFFEKNKYYKCTNTCGIDTINYLRI
jgi:hypothetical protein